jgi:hypothetical protein
MQQGRAGPAYNARWLQPDRLTQALSHTIVPGPRLEAGSVSRYLELWAKEMEGDGKAWAHDSCTPHGCDTRWVELVTQKKGASSGGCMSAPDHRGSQTPQQLVKQPPRSRPGLLCCGSGAAKCCCIE